MVFIFAILVFILGIFGLAFLWITLQAYAFLLKKGKKIAYVFLALSIILLAFPIDNYIPNALLLVAINCFTVYLYRTTPKDY